MTTRLALLRRQSFRQELWFAASFVLVVLGAVALGADTWLAVAGGLVAYALWHLAQAARLLAFLLHDRDPRAGLHWGIWREAFAQVGRLKRRDRKRRRRQRRFFSRFRKVVAAMPDGVIILGDDGEVSWCNRQSKAYFGLPDSHILGRRLVDLVDHPVLRDYLELGNFRRVFEIEAPGDPAIMLSVSVTRFKKGRQRFLLVARDITRLHNLNRTQRDFALNVSHELRTPLTVLNGYIETLSDAEDAQSPRRRPLLRMMEQARRMSEVIRDLSMLSRLETGAEPVQSESVAVYGMLEDIVQEASELARDTQHTLELAGDPGLRLSGDASLLRCAFSNLVFNAIRHTPDRTRIRVAWRPDGDDAVLEVQDNGTGIAARHLARLSERFYRVDAGRSRDAGGTGLGLAIVRQILDLHDARLLISSEEGHGSTFACRFPLQPDTGKAPGNPA